jgi:hypothetical protein
LLIFHPVFNRSKYRIRGRECQGKDAKKQGW